MRNEEIRDFQGVEEFPGDGEGVKMPQGNGISEGVGYLEESLRGRVRIISGTTQCAFGEFIPSIMNVTSVPLCC